MNSQPQNTISWYKLALVSTGFILIINAGADLIATKLNTKHLSLTFNWEYLLFSIGLEGTLIFLCTSGTFLITKKRSDFNFGTVAIRLIIFASFYLILSLITSCILLLIYDVDFKSFNWNFNSFTTGMRYSFVFKITWMVLNYRNQITGPIDLHM
jgi:hypothetical protein